MPCLVKRMGGKEVHCTLFCANLRANVCAELGYEFYDINADQMDVVSYKTQKRHGVAGVRAEVGGLCTLNALYYTFTGRSQVYSSFSRNFVISEALIHVYSLHCR